MFKAADLILFICETSVHAGTGSEIGIVDLPIQRESHTKFPKIESSSIKGSIRDFVSSQTECKDLVDPIFGPEQGDLHASAITFLDAKILLFPVKSAKNIFAWVTCPMVLKNFLKTVELLNVKNPKLASQRFLKLSEIANQIEKFENTVSSEDSLVENSSTNAPGGKQIIEGKVVLEEYVFDVTVRNETKEIAEFLADLLFGNEISENNADKASNEAVDNFWKSHLKSNLVILSDNDFEYFVEYSTEVVTRIAIDKLTGTVKEGALWTEEYLPENTVMFTGVLFTDLRTSPDVRDAVIEKLKGRYNVATEVSLFSEAEAIQDFLRDTLNNKIIQIGGNQSLGKGFVRMRVIG